MHIEIDQFYRIMHAFERRFTLYRFQNTGLLGVFCLIIVLWEGKGGVNTPKLPGFGLGSGN